MTKIKNNLIYIILALLIVATLGVFYGCNKGEEQDPYTVTGHGSVTESLDENGDIISLTATADKWNTFSGWYDGLIKYSNQKTITITKNTPKGLVAKFETNGMTGVDRLLFGTYQRYADVLEGEGEYLNFSCDADISVVSGLLSKTLSFTSGGYASKDGNGFNAYSRALENDKQVFATYYTDDTENAGLYIDFGTHKVAVGDFNTLGKMPFSLATFDGAWNLVSLLDEDIYKTLDDYLGTRNAVGFVEEVENSPTQTRLVLNLDKLLNELKDRIYALTDPKWQGIKDVVETLTNQYSGIANKLPKIQLSIYANYEKVGEEERLSSLEMTALFEEDYLLEIENTLVTIPQGMMTVNLKNAQIAISDTPNAIPQEIISTFPQAVHAVNFHAEGTLSFLKENVATLNKRVIDQYLVELDADINFRCLENAIEEDEINVEKIDWNKFGFLSFKITLIENLDDANQSNRHNGSTEYLNILIDTQKFGAKALIHADLYNPKTLQGAGTSTYILNGSYDLAELARILPKVAGDLEEEYENPTPANLVMTTATASFGIIQSSPDEILHNILINILKNIDPDNQIVAEGLEITEFGTTLAVEKVKDLIEEKFASANDTLASLGLHNNLFGNETSHIAYKTGTFTYGITTQNADGEYVDAQGNKFADEFNQKHITLIGVADGTDMFTETFTLANIADEVNALVGKYVTVTKGTFSDGSESTTFANCAGNQAEIAMRVYSARYEMTGTDTAKITTYLTFSAGTLQSLMTGTFNVPYGLVEYTFEVQL